MLPMKQIACFISTYASDLSGVCSALYELGGMTIMHDASGCISTYATHDEPRWYDSDSMVYLSGLTEIDAIMGDDEKLIRQITETAKELSPKFIAIAGSPIPMMIGTDFPAIAAEVEKKTGIPSFGFPTNGMHSYLSGVSMAFQALANRAADRQAVRTQEPSVNIIGLTPLDFSVNGSAESICARVEDAGFRIIGRWAMGGGLAEIREAGRASVNLVVSASGIAAARELQKIFQTPFVVGVPYGKDFSKKLLSDLKTAAETGQSIVSYAGEPEPGKPEIAIVGESVSAGSLARAVTFETGKSARIICPLESSPELFSPDGKTIPEEEDLADCLKNYQTVVADPLYKPICPTNCRFVPLPHEAFSGRIFRKKIPNLVKSMEVFVENL